MASAFSIGRANRGTEDRSSATPGPGAYHSCVPMKSTPPAITLGTEPRETKVPNLNPGPAKYTPSGLKSQANIFTFGIKTRPKERGSTPGPGQYLGTEGNSDTPKYSFPCHTGQKGKRQVTPGPGSYQLNRSTLEVPSCKMGRSTKQSGQVTPSKYPGPGAYNETFIKLLMASPKYAFSKDSRVEKKKESPRPGPGQYHPPTSSFQKQFSQTMQGRNVSRSPNHNFPGPASYNSNVS